MSNSPSLKAIQSFGRKPHKADIELERLTDGKFGNSTDTMVLYEAIETLPEKYRMPLMLFAIGEYDINEIAPDLHLNGATARMRWGLFGKYAGTRGTVF